MTSSRMCDIDAMVETAEQEGWLQDYYRYAPGDCGIRHSMSVTVDGGYTLQLNCNTRAMRILARVVYDNEPITEGLIQALRYVR